MTMRALFAFLGLATCIPAVAFLILFRPPRSNHRGQVVGRSLRLLSTALAAGGFRILEVNIVHADMPVVFLGWFDELTVLSTLVLAAAASMSFLWVYLRYRIWEEDQ